MANNEKITTAKALELLKACAPAIAHLERITQGTVNGNAVVIADAVKEGEDVDGGAISKSWKVRSNASKFGKMLVKMAEVAEGHIAYEAKQKSIPAEVVRATKELPAPALAK